MVDSRKSFRNLAETLHALLAVKANVTPNWVKSVCDIVKTLPSEFKPTNFEDDSANAISRIKDELATLTTHINQLNMQRRQLLNDFLDLKGNIRVFCRIRPVTLGENFGRLRPVVAVDSSNVLIKLADKKSKSYSFDRVFQPTSSQDEVFSEVEPVIKSVLDGYNACIFAYGQTGSGKTFTMEGRPDAPGVVPCTFEALFKQAIDSNHSFLISFSMLEIYMGNLKDLLVPKPARATNPISPCMTRIAITCYDAPERRRETNKIWLVDLGGSERVLKTKASGKRLDEGKAINLSLSALGDVISALQRKKHYIPYRNSKLTQVLKDSLGDDSKTLMLVHEVRGQKEVAMANLQQKMIEIEHEQQHIRSEILKLKKRLENLTGENLSSEEQLEAYSFIEEPLTKNRAGDTTAVTMSKLPRFMRPTICSQKKSGTNYQTSECKVPVSGRRRRPSSHRAESVTFPVKEHSDHKSECSISRSSCLVGLDTRNSADNATEYSQDTSETDIKIIDFQEQEKVQRNSASQMADISGIQKNTNRQTAMTNYIKFTKVDSWLDLQKNETNMSGYTHRTKQVLAIPIPRKKQKHHEQSKAKNAFNEETHSFCDSKIQKEVNHNQRDKLVTASRIGRPISEVGIDKPLTMLQDLFNQDSRSDFFSISQTTEGKRMIQTQESVDNSSTVDDKWGTFSPEDVCCHTLGEYKDHDHALSDMQTVEGQKQISDGFQLQNNGSWEFLPSDLDSSTICSKGDSGDSMSKLELDSCHQQVSTELITEDGERQDSDSSIQTSAKERRHGMLELRSQRALFVSYTKQKDLNKQFDKPQEETQTTGICHILKQKIEILCASALLGLGFCNLGYEHEFFYSLML